MSELRDLSLISPDASFRGAASGGDAPTQEAGYYGAPVLKKPHWGRSVVTYLFLGGIMGGSAIIVAFADRNDEGGRRVARNGRYLNLALALACPAVLISHLGRPERFLNMLRIVKFKSPMSLGVWGLVAYGKLAGFAAVAQAARDGLLPRWLRFLSPGRGPDVALALLGAIHRELHRRAPERDGRAAVGEGQAFHPGAVRVLRRRRRVRGARRAARPAARRRTGARRGSSGWNSSRRCANSRR